MNVIDPGHDYLLATLDGDGSPQRLTFVKREGSRYPGNVGAHPGTTMQEVLRALIDRARYVNAQIPSSKTEAAISLMATCVLLFETRAAEEHDRKACHPTLAALMQEMPCPRCGHVGDHMHTVGVGAPSGEGPREGA